MIPPAVRGSHTEGPVGGEFDPVDAGTADHREIYWRLYDNPGHARDCIGEFRIRYNDLRPHWALIPEAGGDPLTPEDVYVGGGAIQIPKWQGWAKGAKQRLDELMGQAAMPEAVATAPTPCSRAATRSSKTATVGLEMRL